MTKRLCFVGLIRQARCNQKDQKKRLAGVTWSRDEKDIHVKRVLQFIPSRDLDSERLLVIAVIVYTRLPYIELIDDHKSVSPTSTSMYQYRYEYSRSYRVSICYRTHIYFIFIFVFHSHFTPNFKSPLYHHLVACSCT